MRGLTADETQLLGHVSLWGSDGYPIKKLGKGWAWDFLSIKGPPVVFKRKRDAVSSFEAFYQVLLDAKAGRI